MLSPTALDLPAGVYKDSNGAKYLLIAVSRHAQVMNWLVTYAVLSPERGNSVWSTPVEKWNLEMTFCSTDPNQNY